MTEGDALDVLLAAERAEQPTLEVASAGLKSLLSALDANVAPMVVASGPLKVGASLSVKSFVGSGLIAFTVTTGGLAAHAIVRAQLATVAPAAVEVSPREPADVPRAPPPPAVSLAIEKPLSQAPASARTPAPSARSSTFAAELQLIKRAKLALDTRDEHLAHVWLDEHARLYPRGIFAPEREQLRERASARPDGNGKHSLDRILK